MSVVLTELQMRVMDTIWDRGEATVSEVRDALHPERNLARTTVATLLSRLEERELLDHRTRGREYVYRPLVERKDVRRSMIREFTDRVFGGDVAGMIRHLLGSSQVDPEDLREVRRLLVEKEEELPSEASEDGLDDLDEDR